MGDGGDAADNWGKTNFPINDAGTTRPPTSHHTQKQSLKRKKKWLYSLKLSTLILFIKTLQISKKKTNKKWKTASIGALQKRELKLIRKHQEKWCNLISKHGNLH